VSWRDDAGDGPWEWAGRINLPPGEEFRVYVSGARIPRARVAVVRRWSDGSDPDNVLLMSGPIARIAPTYCAPTAREVPAVWTMAQRLARDLVARRRGRPVCTPEDLARALDEARVALDLAP
jgi:hypothetical protein